MANKPSVKRYVKRLKFWNYVDQKSHLPAQALAKIPGVQAKLAARSQIAHNRIEEVCRQYLAVVGLPGGKEVFLRGFAKEIAMFVRQDPTRLALLGVEASEHRGELDTTTRATAENCREEFAYRGLVAPSESFSIWIPANHDLEWERVSQMLDA